jgi:oxygen-independent coproporphyrinogen-3 oxidase
MSEQRKTPKELIQKYNIPVPRYTSYPTVPYWQTAKPSTQDWIKRVQNSFQIQPEISLYIHLPFCENLCTYCGCNKRITKNHKVESPYIDALLAEWQMYLQILPSKPTIKEIHLGGGTPTFFQPNNLKHLLSTILESSEVSSNFDFSLEVHPNSTSIAHLQTLHDLGFKRVSIGIQDFDPKILNIINRHQTHEQIINVTQAARDIGYQSINYDLIFGLPLQTKAHISDNMAKLEVLRPDRIAFYSYAHVPWKSKSQRAYSEKDLPSNENKRSMYELGRQILEKNGYEEIGMDHFALPSDDLSKALNNKSLHRNFMGYTPYHTELMIGLGCSSISDSFSAFVQNEKKVEDYQNRVGAGELPFYRGHLLTNEDQVLRRHITNIMCNLETNWEKSSYQHSSLFEGLKRMQPLINDGLLKMDSHQLKVTELGRPFVRNIAMCLDARLWRRKPASELFSMSI